MHARLVHGGEEDGRAQVVVARVERQVGRFDARADHGGLVADDVHAVEEPRPARVVAHVVGVRARRRLGGAVGLRDHRVDTDDLVAPLGEPAVDGAADEPGGPGEQDPHQPGTP